MGLNDSSRRLRVERLEDRVTPATHPAGFTETVIADGVSGGTAMELAPNGDVWALEKNGKVSTTALGRS